LKSIQRLSKQSQMA